MVNGFPDDIGERVDGDVSCSVECYTCGVGGIREYSDHVGMLKSTLA